MNFTTKENIKRTISANNLTALKKIIDNLDIKFTPDNQFIELACENGFLDIVKYLLSFEEINPSDNYQYSLEIASEYGYYKIVELLLKDPRIDPSKYNNSAIDYAFEYKKYDVARLLLKDERVKKNLKKDKPAIYNYFIKEFIQEKIINFD